MCGWGWRTIQVILLSLLLAAGTAAAAPITTLVVTSSSGVPPQAAMFAGIARGIFERHSLRIQIITTPTGFEALKQVTDGTAQIGNGAPTAIAQTMAQGARLKSIVASWGDATGSVPTDNAIAVVARASAGIREGHLEDLRGKKVGVPRGTDFHQYLLAALAARGLDPVTAVTIVSTPPSGLPGALQNGSVDAVVALEPSGSQILSAMRDAVLVQRGEKHIQFMALCVVSPQYLATHPGTIKRYLTAFAESAQYVRTHPDEATDVMLREIPGVDRPMMRAAVGFVNLDPRVSKVTVRAAEEGYDFAIKIGALKRAPTFDEMFDLGILRQVEREHPELFRDLPPIPNALKL